MKFRISTDKKEEGIKGPGVENAPKLKLTNDELESPSQHKHILKNFYGGHQPLTRNDINEKMCIDDNTKELAKETLMKKEENFDLELKSTSDTIIKKDEREHEEITHTEYEMQDGKSDIFSSEKRGTSTILPKINNVALNDRVPLRFQPVQQRLPDSELSSWSSMTADNSLSDLYCDDELKLSLEFDPNMQLFTTIEEEGDQELVFSNIQRVPEGKAFNFTKFLKLYFRYFPHHVSKLRRS